MAIELQDVASYLKFDRLHKRAENTKYLVQIKLRTYKKRTFHDQNDVTKSNLTDQKIVDVVYVESAGLP